MVPFMCREAVLFVYNKYKTNKQTNDRVNVLFEFRARLSLPSLSLSLSTINQDDINYINNCHHY